MKYGKVKANLFMFKAAWIK